MSKEKDNQNSENNSESISELSNLYKQIATKESPVHLDREILDASRKAVDLKPRFSLTPFINQNYVPLSFAAIIFICVSVVFNIYHENNRKIFKLPDTTTDDEMILFNTNEDKAEGNDENNSLSKTFDHDYPIKKSTPETLVQPAVKPPQIQKKTEFHKPDPADKKMIWQKDESSDAISPAEEKDLKSRISDEPEQNKKMMLKENTSSSILEAEAEYNVFDSTDNSPESSLILIKNLWDEGKLDQVRIEYDKFKLEYPDYNAEKLNEILPSELQGYLMKNE